jgi:hypothetical protein
MLVLARQVMVGQQPSPWNSSGEVDCTADMHLLRNQLDLLLHVLQALLQHPLIRCHLDLRGRLLHIQDQMRALDQPIRALAADALLSQMAAPMTVAGE